MAQMEGGTLTAGTQKSGFPSASQMYYRASAEE